MNNKPVVAMALGGLGGFNAHDAGVLAAAHECGLKPDIITCTSGAIFWTHLFLTNPDGIRAEVAGLRAARRDDARGLIRIEPITMHRPLGYFNYFVEKLPNYTEGYEQAKQVFQRDVAKTAVTASRANSAVSGAGGSPRLGGQ